MLIMHILFTVFLNIFVDAIYDFLFWGNITDTLKSNECQNMMAKSILTSCVKTGQLLTLLVY